VEGLGFHSDYRKMKMMDQGLVDMLGIMHEVEDNPNAVRPVETTFLMRKKIVTSFSFLQLWLF
jgi:hypothetical protein